MPLERILFLNGLRGVLALVVFLHHFFYLFVPDLVFGGTYQQFVNNEWPITRIIAYSPFNLFFNPGAAINFFFLISGYIQSLRYSKTNDLVFIQAGFLKRYFRLALPTLAVVMIVFVFHRWHLINKSGFPTHEMNFKFINAVLPDNFNIFEAIRFGSTIFFESNPGYYSVLWTMPIELYSSLMVFIILMVTHQNKNKIWLFLFWLLLQLFVLNAFYSALFTIGVLIAFVENRPLQFRMPVLPGFLKFFLLVGGVYFSSYPYTGFENAAYWSMYMPISFFDLFHNNLVYLIGDTFLFILLLYSQRIKKILSHPVFLFFGNISFMFYLIHFLLLFSLAPSVYSAIVGQLNPVETIVITGLVTFLAVCAVSWLLFKTIDVPTKNALDRLSKKLLRQ